MICPVCSSDNIALYLKGVFDSDDTNVLECNECGLQFLDNIMSEKEEKEFYLNYYKMQGLRQYKQMDLNDFQKRALVQYHKNKEIYFSLLNEPETILEIGSGHGAFLRFIKENYHNKTIVSAERSEQNYNFLVEDCKNIFEDIEFYKDSSDIIDKQFDLICSFGVFEHIKDSKTFLKQNKKLLKDNNSKLVLTFPNKNTPLVSLFDLEEFKKFTYMKMHYYTFSEKSMYLLAESSGFVVEEFKYLQVWELDNTLSWLRYREPREFSQYTNILSKETIESYNKDLVKNKLTDLMMVILRKQEF